MSLDSIRGITKIAHGGPLYTLWTKYGKWESEKKALFEKLEVVRETGADQASAGVEVPTSCLVSKLSEDDCKEHNLKVSSILIRDDYRQALSDICYFASKLELPHPSQHNAVSSELVENPFVKTELVSSRAAVTLIGHPGVGKSLWQLFVLQLRILAGSPTIFQNTGNICHVFNPDGLYEVNIQDVEADSRLFYEAISPQYWCLVDCNRVVLDVPVFLENSPAFIVQSASPRKDRLEWMKHYSGYHIKYYMKEWSLSELIMGRTLQSEKEPCSEANLEQFHSMYAPSARMAYVHSYQNRFSSYDLLVRGEVSQLTFENVTDVLSAATSLAIEKVSHHILLVSPGSDRMELTVTIPTRHIYTMLREHLHIQTLQEATRLYQIFVGDEPTKGSAGHIFADVHDLFCKGGEWALTAMTKNKAGRVNTHFKTLGRRPKISYMSLGFGGNTVKISKTSLPEDAEFANLANHRYLVGQPIALENGYYRPASGPPTFDGFIYDAASGTATMLQMTVSSRHSVNTKDVEWLNGLGVAKFRLVAVTPDTTLDLLVPNALVSRIGNVYQLTLDEIV